MQLKYYSSPVDEILYKGYSSLYSSSLITHKYDVQQITGRKDYLEQNEPLFCQSFLLKTQSSVGVLEPHFMNVCTD